VKQQKRSFFKEKEGEGTMYSSKKITFLLKVVDDPEIWTNKLISCYKSFCYSNNGLKD